MLIRLTYTAFVAVIVLAIGLAVAAPDPLVIERGTNSTFSSMVRPVPSYVDSLTLSANVAGTQEIPSGSRWVLFSSSCGLFYAKANAVATVPGATTTTGAASELNPAAWDLRLQEITTISVISPGDCIVALSFYS